MAALSHSECFFFPTRSQVLNASGLFHEQQDATLQDYWYLEASLLLQ